MQPSFEPEDHFGMDDADFSQLENFRTSSAVPAMRYYKHDQQVDVFPSGVMDPEGPHLRFQLPPFGLTPSGISRWIGSRLSSSRAAKGLSGGSLPDDLLTMIESSVAIEPRGNPERISSIAACIRGFQELCPAAQHIVGRPTLPADLLTEQLLTGHNFCALLVQDGPRAVEQVELYMDHFGSGVALLRGRDGFLGLQLDGIRTAQNFDITVPGDIYGDREDIYAGYVAGRVLGTIVRSGSFAELAAALQGRTDPRFTRVRES